MFGFKKKVNLKIAQSFDSEKTPKMYFIVLTIGTYRKNNIFQSFKSLMLSRDVVWTIFDTLWSSLLAEKISTSKKK